MTDILILTASFGMGHNSVSKAIKEQLESEDTNVKVDIADLWEIINPKIKDLGSKMYYGLTENYPTVYNTIYGIKKTYKNNIIDGIICTAHYKKLYNFISDENPKIIISTFPLCSCLVSKIKREYGLKTNLVTVITDVVDSWEWIYDETNMYLVPSNDIKERLIEKGIDKDSIIATGIPVKKDFLNSNSNYVIKDKLLIVASGMSVDDISEDMVKKLSHICPLKTIIVTGRNEKLYKKLSCMEMDTNHVEILGFVNNLDKLMDEAVFIITKPGGVTLFEAICKELPLIIIDSSIGQEKGNIDYIKRNNIGIVIDDIDELIDVITIYVNDLNKIEQIYKNIRNIKSNLKFNEVADYILQKTV
nr:glycosyltransferase [Sedimentibacter sp.]